MSYLLDTNICIYILRGKYHLNEKIKSIGYEKCLISEITYAELIYGAEYSNNIEKNYNKINYLLGGFKILSINEILQGFAKEKARLRKLGQSISDFDLLIGATAVFYNLILVTQNTKDFQRMEGIQLEDWTKSRR